MSDPSPSRTCPARLRHELMHAAQLSCEIARLAERVDDGDLSFVWLVGRAEEVRAVVGNTMSEWRAERIEAEPAAERIQTYVRAVESSLHSFFGARARAASAVPFRPQSDTLIDY
jgi:hypothetical protein